MVETGSGRSVMYFVKFRPALCGKWAETFRTTDYADIDDKGKPGKQK